MEQKSRKIFQEKDICIEDALLFHPDFLQLFGIHIDASKYQMGGIISQNGNAIAYWSKKLSKTQKRYPTIVQELLAITKILKDYRQILYRHCILIWISHKNLTYMATQFSSNRVLWQCLSIKAFGPVVNHIDGEKNIAADTISCIEEAKQKVNINKFIKTTSAK